MLKQSSETPVMGHLWVASPWSLCAVEGAVLPRESIMILIDSIDTVYTFQTELSVQKLWFGVICVYPNKGFAKWCWWAGVFKTAENSNCKLDTSSPSTRGLINPWMMPISATNEDRPNKIEKRNPITMVIYLLCLPVLGVTVLCLFRSA